MSSDAPRPRFVAAAAQLTAGADLHANLATCRRLAADAAGRGAKLLVLPECFAFIGNRLSDRFAIAETLDTARPGPVLSAVLDMARENQLWVVAGGMPERLPEDGDSPDISRVHNTCAVISPAAEVTSVYRKIHLFDVQIPGRAEFRESESTAAGADRVVAETPLARIGLSICYDVRFPELYRELTLSGGAEVLLVPAAFTAHTGAAHWHTLLRARAIENQCYVIAAAQAGQHNDKRSSYGHSLIIDPWGRVIAELADGVGLAAAEIDLGVVDETRTQMPCLEHHAMGDRPG
jgi:deaminated glutathione amidase